MLFLRYLAFFNRAVWEALKSSVRGSAEAPAPSVRLHIACKVPLALTQVPANSPYCRTNIKGPQGGYAFCLNDTFPISQTNDPQLFRCERIGFNTYKFRVPPGLYQVRRTFIFVKIGCLENRRCSASLVKQVQFTTPKAQQSVRLSLMGRTLRSGCSNTDERPFGCELSQDARLGFVAQCLSAVVILA